MTYTNRIYWAIPFLLFLAVSILNVNANRIKNRKLAKFTKPLLMPLLLLTYYIILPDQRQSWAIQWPIIMALLIHTLGDVFLMIGHKETPLFFGSGILCFFIGHMFYILWFFRQRMVNNLIGIIAALFVLLPLLYWLYVSHIKKADKFVKLFFPYCFALAALAVVIAGTFTFGAFSESLLCLIGISLFCFSDFLIARDVLGRKLFGNTTVMWTYILAQTMLVAGIAAFQIV